MENNGKENLAEQLMNVAFGLLSVSVSSSINYERSISNLNERNRQRVAFDCISLSLSLSRTPTFFSITLNQFLLKLMHLL